MTNNDILRRLRYAFDFDDHKMIGLFALAEKEVTQLEIHGWLKKDEEDENFVSLRDIDLATFLNGLIYDKRGKQEGKTFPPEKSLNNNIIFRKLKIALNLKDTDILSIFEGVKFDISKHELSAFFRKPGQKQYRECKDQFLRVFIQGMQEKYRKK